MWNTKATALSIMQCCIEIDSLPWLQGRLPFFDAMNHAHCPDARPRLREGHCTFLCKPTHTNPVFTAFAPRKATVFWCNESRALSRCATTRKGGPLHIPVFTYTLHVIPKPVYTYTHNSCVYLHIIPNPVYTYQHSSCVYLHVIPNLVHTHTHNSCVYLHVKPNLVHTYQHTHTLTWHGHSLACKAINFPAGCCCCWVLVEEGGAVGH